MVKLTSKERCINIPEMRLSIRTVACVIFLATACTVFFIVKYQSPQWVESLYQQKQFELLNKISGGYGERSLGFYLGKSEEMLFGPVTQLVSGTAFALLMGICFPAIGFGRFVGAVAGYLLITKWEALFFPLYGDTMGGPFAEAMWLANNNFNYLELFRHPGYAAGGPKVYFFSIYPTYAAILMKLLPWPKVFLFVNHLIVFLMAAVIAALVRQLLLKHFREDSATLGALLLLFMPVFQSQTEAVNMEMPTVFFATLSAYYLIQNKIGRATAMAVLSVLAKGTGVFACMAVFAVIVLLFFIKNEFQFNRRLLWAGAGLLAASIFSAGGKFLIHDQHVAIGGVNFLEGWGSISKFRIFYILIYSTAVYLGYGLYLRKKKLPEDFWRYGVMFVFGAMWFLLFLNFYALLHRYSVTVYPFIVFCAIFAAGLIIKNNTVRKWSLIIIIAVTLWSSYGTNQSYRNQHFILERSLEYRNGLTLSRLVAQRVEERYSQFKIGAQLITAQLLAFPEFGYVSKDLDVMIYGFQCLYPGIENYPGMKNLDIRRTIYITQADEWFQDAQFPMSDQDKIIDEIEWGDRKAYFFMGGVGIERRKMLNDLWRAQQAGLTRKEQ